MVKAGRRGFTLIEVMLAILILGIVLSTIYVAWTGTLRIAREGDYADRVYAMARVAMKQMTEDLESLSTYEERFVFEGITQDRWGDSFTALRFVSSRRMGFSERTGGLPEIIWYSREDPDGDGWVLIRNERMYRDRSGEIGFDPFDSAEGYRVAENLRGLRCLFFDRRGEEHRRWDSRSGNESQRNRIPAVISIELEFENPGNPEQPWLFMTKVFIPLAEGVSGGR